MFQPPLTPQWWRSRPGAYWRLARFDKPVGIYLLLWPTLWALWLAAEGLPDLPRLAVFLAGTVLMRAAGCVINDLADRRFDGAVRRTAQRVLATGEVRPREALILALVLLALAASLLTWLSEQARLLSWGALAVATAYPFCKRFFPAPQAVLGIAFSFGIPMAFADTLPAEPAVPAVAWWLMLANLLWTLAYDTAYAMVDREDDLALGLNSSAITLGRWDVLGVSLFQLGFLGLMAWVGWTSALGLGYALCWALALAWSLRLLSLLASRRREDCFTAFLQSHWVGALLWLGLVVDLQL